MYQSDSKFEFIAKAELGFLDLSDLFLGLRVVWIARKQQMITMSHNPFVVEIVSLQNFLECIRGGTQNELFNWKYFHIRQQAIIQNCD